MKSAYKKQGFTLAEVLITLAIIGVVAALTIPSLLTTIKTKVRSSQIEVANKKLVNGLNLFNSQENGLTRSYATTYEFLKELSKYYKMSSVCDSENIQNCFPYDTIHGQKKSVAVSSLKTALSLGLPDGYLEPAGFISATGIPYIVSYKKDCIEDPDVALKDITTCLDGIYDISGVKSPNKYGEDVQAIHAALFDGACLFVMGGACVRSKPFLPTPIPYSECVSAGIKRCRPQYESDYWAGAKKYCMDRGGDLPLQTQLCQIATELYGVPISKATHNITYNEEKALKYGFPTMQSAGNNIQFWERGNQGSKFQRSFRPDKTIWQYANENYRDKFGICVSK